MIRNPLPPGEFNRLPGSENGERLSWQVTTSGRREHFIIAASPQPTPMLEELIERIPAPALGRPVRNHRLPGSAASLLRSVGGLVAAPAATDRRLRDDPTFATPLTDGEEEVQGVWIPPSHARQSTVLTAGAGGAPRQGAAHAPLLLGRVRRRRRLDLIALS